MMGARNENSVLFSLDSLRSLDVGRVDERPAPVARRPAPEPEPQDGSGLIDVRAMSAMIQAERPQPRAPRFSELTAAPLLIPPTPVSAQRPATVAPPPLPLYLVLGLVALGMMALATHMAVRGPAPPPVVIERHIAAAPLAVAEAPEPEAEPEPEAVEPEAPAAVTVAEPEPVPSKRPRKPSSKPATPTSEKPQPAKVTTPAAPSGPAPDSVECLLAPGGCKAKPSSPPPAVDQPPAVSSNSLPEKLEPGDIADGTRAAKATALERCRVHARGGEKVTIKLSISGPDGTVLSSAPQDDAGNSALANCCAGELMRATFKKVSKAQIGAVATLKF